jgi:heavy metal sensor kinase
MTATSVNPDRPELPANPGHDKEPARKGLSLSTRLTLWYSTVFTLSSAVAFILFYLLINQMVYRQIDDNLTRQAAQFTTLLRNSGLNAVKSAAVLEAQAAGEREIFIRLLRWNGETFSSSNMSYWKDIPVDMAVIQRLNANRRRAMSTIRLPQRDDRIRTLYELIGPGVILQLGHSMAPFQHFVGLFRAQFALTMIALIGISTLIGWFMARRALAGVARVTQTARGIAAGALNRRVPLASGGDEIDQLALTFNQMLDRIETLINSVRDMSDNIAHDLRSPITRIRGLAEITLTTDRSLADYQQMAASTIEECDRLLEMINTMLMISKTEAGIEQMAHDQIDFSRLVQEAYDLFLPLAEEKDIDFRCSLPDTPVTLAGDKRLLQRMIANLMDNALKYTPQGESVSVTLRYTASMAMACLQVQDTGEGIAPDDVQYIFDRFFRGDQSRSQTGSGLGLSLARAVTQAHGGDLTVSSRYDHGTTFEATVVIKKA